MFKKRIILTLLMLTLLLVAGCSGEEEVNVRIVELEEPQKESEVAEEAAGTTPPDNLSLDSDVCLTYAIEESEQQYAEASQQYEEAEPGYSVINMPHGYLAIQHIFFINDYLPSRIAFSCRERDAAKWIIEELLVMGYVADEIEMQTFSRDAAQLRLHPERPLHTFDTSAFDMRLYSQNVILTVPGQSEYTIVIGAHYDSYPYPGASDNASGMGILLELAHRLRFLDNYFTVEFVFFGAEESWWIGAHYYLYRLCEESKHNIVLMVNADILLDGDTLIYATGHGANRNNPDTNDMTIRIDSVAERLNAQYGLELISVPRGLSINSDHTPFFYAGHTALFLFAADYEVPGGRFFNNRLFHTARDCIHYINANMPGRTERNMRAFAIFLEEILLLSTCPVGTTFPN